MFFFYFRYKLYNYLQKIPCRCKSTQEEVAEKVGITARFLMVLENEEKRPSIDILLRLVDTLNIPGDAILHPQIQHIDSEDQQLLVSIVLSFCVCLVTYYFKLSPWLFSILQENLVSRADMDMSVPIG